MRTFWDAIYRFAYGHHSRKILKREGCGTFDHYYEPLGILTGRIIQFLFVRGDVAEAKGPIFVHGWKDPEWKAQFDPMFDSLGLYARIGSAPETMNRPDTVVLTGKDKRSKLPDDAKKAVEKFLKTGKILSSTGEIAMDRNALRVSVVTPKSEVFTFNGGSIAGKFMKLSKSPDFSTVSVHSMDGKKLADSRDLIVFHLTNALNLDTEFQNDEMRLALNNGKPVVLVQRGRADVSLKVDPRVKAWKVQAINLDGSVLGEIPSVLKDGLLQFRAEVFNRCGVTMIYRILPR